MERRRQPLFRVLAIEEFESKTCLTAITSFLAADISLGMADGAFSVFAADFDGDNDIDVLSASRTSNRIAWYENMDGRGTFSPQKVITEQAGDVRSVHAADIDGDGDFDVLSASAENDTIAWYENEDARGTFGQPRVITDRAIAAGYVHAADVDNDGDTDVLAAPMGGVLSWFENKNGEGEFGTAIVISTATDEPRSVLTVDIDGDGDLDALSASSEDGKIAWYENTDGKGNFGHQIVLTDTARGATTVFGADVDGDGDFDVVAASLLDEVFWFENTDGHGTFGAKRFIAAGGAGSLFAADVDGDGDQDVLAATPLPLSSGQGVSWFENTDGRGAFGPRQVIADVRLAWSVYASDLDGDGLLDVLSASFGDDRIAWYRQVPPLASAGDANRDGRFDFRDIIQILKAGKYLSGNPATWEEGDFNGDGLFNSLDIAVALANGQYQRT